MNATSSTIPVFVGVAAARGAQAPTRTEIARSAPIAAPLRALTTNPNYFTDGSGKAVYLELVPKPSVQPSLSRAFVEHFVEPCGFWRFSTKWADKVHDKGPARFSWDMLYLTGSHTWNDFQDWGTDGSPQPFNFAAYVKMLVAHHHNFTLVSSGLVPRKRLRVQNGGTIT
jgi:hypothetical protein